MTVERRSEVVLPLRVARQPHPAVNPGGDCGPCCVAGVLGMSGPAAVYEGFNGGKPESFTHFEMARILRSERFDRTLEDVLPTPVVPMAHRAFGAPSWTMAHEWFRLVQVCVDAGLYGFAQVNHGRQGHEMLTTDHWVLICGARSWITWTDGALAGSKRGEHTMQVLVSCSASCPDGEWVDAGAFLKHRGGWNLLFARPAK